MFKEPVLIFQLYTVITQSPTVPYRYPHYWKSLTIHCCICVLLSYVEMLHELSKSLISPCKNCMEELHAHMYKGRTLLIYLEGSLRVILFFNLLRFSSRPPTLWVHISEIILQTKWGNGLMRDACFTHNSSGMLQMHRGRPGCTLRLALWHGFCGAG